MENATNTCKADHYSLEGSSCIKLEKEACITPKHPFIELEEISQVKLKYSGIRNIITPANFITMLRIACAIAILFFPALSWEFFVAYTIAGISDIFDGFVARKTHTVSRFGSVLDSVADFALVVVCLIKLIPEITLPLWLILWIVVIAGIKTFNIILYFAKQKQALSNHSTLNKITGLLLFLLTYTLPFVNIEISGFIVCAVATCAAIAELWRISCSIQHPSSTI